MRTCIACIQRGGPEENGGLLLSAVTDVQLNARETARLAYSLVVYRLIPRS